MRAIQALLQQQHQQRLPPPGPVQGVDASSSRTAPHNAAAFGAVGGPPAQTPAATTAAAGGPQQHQQGPTVTHGYGGPPSIGQNGGPQSREQGPPSSSWRGPPAAGQTAFNSGQGPPPEQIGSCGGAAEGPPSRAWPGTTHTWQGAPPSGAAQGPLSCSSSVAHDESSLLLDLEDIADAFGQEPPAQQTAPPQWKPEEPPPPPQESPVEWQQQGPSWVQQQGPPQGPPKLSHQQHQPGSQTTIQYECQGAPQQVCRQLLDQLPSPGPLQWPPTSQEKPQQVIYDDSRAALEGESVSGSESITGVCTPQSESSSLCREPHAPVQASGVTGASFANQGKGSSGDPEVREAPFWVFGAVINARERGEAGAEWDLLITDGMRVFAAVSGAELGNAIINEVRHTSLFPSLSPVEKMRSVQGQFLVQIHRNVNAERGRVRIIAFRANAPRGEVAEKLKYLRSLIEENRKLES